MQLALQSTSRPVQTPAVASDQASRQQLSEAEVAIDKDPTVRALRDRLGAEVVDDSVQPLQ